MTSQIPQVVCDV